MTEEENGKSESQEQQPKKLWKLNEEQYKFLVECSEKGPEGIKQWNEWQDKRQAENRYEMIQLERAELQFAKLQGANLWYANLQGADLMHANLQGADLNNANLQGANLMGGKLQGAELKEIDLQEADLRSTNLQGAKLGEAKLQQANLLSADLQGADLLYAKLQGADLQFAKLQRANFTGAIVNGSTYFLDCKIDEDTDFRHVGLENVRIESGTKILLKYNIRRMNWEAWYKEHSKLKWLVKSFWLVSDYGLSTGRVIAVFFGMAFIFANIYYHWGRLAPPGIVGNLFVGENGVAVQWWLVPLRALYFSIVTMTTLGFGDMYANAHSIWGHVLLSVQVILGYVLLGALVTRLAVLFTSDGPAGKFTPMDDETKEFLASKDKKSGFPLSRE